MNLIFAVLIAAALTGCTAFQQPGTYRFAVTNEGFEVDASTLKGGPEIEWSKDANGVTRLSVKPSRDQIIKPLIQELLTL